MKVLIYARVSTEDQNVQQQVDYCKNWAKQQNHEVVWTIADTESGTKDLIDRKRFQKIINNEYNFNYDAILVYNLDRLTRNWDDVTQIEKFFRNNWDKIKLISTSDSIDFSNANGRAMFRMKMVFSCMMPEDMKEKQKIGIERAKKEGKYTGRKKGALGKKSVL